MMTSAVSNHENEPGIPAREIKIYYLGIISITDPPGKY
jgi:hypothetical protein